MLFYDLVSKVLIIIILYLDWLKVVLNMVKQK